MSHRPANSDWFEKTLESTRRDVRKLEIDACRIRTDLARLEVANAAGAIDGEIAAPIHEAEFDIAQSPPGQTVLDSASLNWQSAAESVPEGIEILVAAPSQVKPSAAEEDGQPILDDAALAELSPVSGLVNRSRNLYRRATSPFMASLVLHGTILVLAVSITVATIERNDPRPTRTIVNLGDESVKTAENIDLHQLADLGTTGAENGAADSPRLDSVATLDHVPMPLDMNSVDGPTSPGQVGAAAFVPSDLGTLMAGSAGIDTDGIGAAAGLGNGKQAGHGGGTRGDGKRAESRRGGRPDSTLFFGTEARGDRFVFVVDNSNSMKNGRLEMAVAELMKTVEGMSPRQNFYVIFVSDRTYPMFYPQQEPSMVAATPANKKRLAEWLPKAILASGKNRELIKAMDLAASLQPQAVYLLWDGGLRYSEKVRLDVVTHLTQPNQWNFIVHTLGMGITSLDSEQNLRTIAQAHRGIYRRIDVPTARAR